MRQLEYFVAVADELSFSRGAARVHVVQSAVSSAIAKLERDLGVTLIDRSRLRITLTAPGAAFLVEARATLDAARRAREAATSFNGQLSGTVDLGTLQSSGGIDVPAVLSWFHDTHPLVAVRLRQSVGGSSDHLAAVADGSMDLALVALTGRPPNGVTTRVLSSEPLLFVCWPDHRLADHDHVVPTDLAGETVIGYPRGWGVRRLTDDAFAAEGVDLAMPYEVSDYRTAAGLVRHRLGVTMMPATEAARLDDLRMLPLEPAVIWNVQLATAAAQRSSAAALAMARAFVDDAERRGTRPPAGW
ncbi:LysR family transcriptional regulator [Mycolicibacterium sp. P1-18]|uniref:LysR family transcriptional regulator n=1 Tax=Mycolicibacterium sp. P1-18 TaxID=2024615 RepID=UPI001F5B04AC|nr:LysR family transcriptional regulator [Mycolicibacterium sp. P1-18]